MAHASLVVAILLGVGYFTRASGTFPRRIFLAWALVTPIALLVVNTGVQEFARRLLCEPAVARMQEEQIADLHYRDAGAFSSRNVRITPGSASGGILPGTSRIIR